MESSAVSDTSIPIPSQRRGEPANLDSRQDKTQAPLVSTPTTYERLKKRFLDNKIIAIVVIVVTVITAIGNLTGAMDRITKYIWWESSKRECWETVNNLGNIDSLCLLEGGRVARRAIFPNQKITSRATICEATGTIRSDGPRLRVSFGLGACDNGRNLNGLDMSCVKHAHSLVCLSEADRKEIKFEKRD